MAPSSALQVTPLVIGTSTAVTCDTRRVRADAEERCTEVARSAWDAGNPVAGQTEDDWKRIANVAVRRWRSAHRRLRKNASHYDRIEDLAKGLRDQMEADPSLAGPLIEDYRSLAGRLAEVIVE